MAAKKLQVGDPAPDFELPGDGGQTIKLSDFRGKRIVLYFYPKDDTPGCTTQACGFRDAYLQIEERNAVVLGISPDGVKSHQKFKTKYKIPILFFTQLMGVAFGIDNKTLGIEKSIVPAEKVLAKPTKGEKGG